MTPRFAVAITLLAAMCCLALIASCTPQPVAYPAAVAAAPVVQQPVAVAPAPVVVQQSNDGFFTGLMMGHFLSGGSTHTIVHAPAPTVVNRTVVNKTVVVNRPAPVVAAPRAAPTVVPRPAPFAAPRPSFSTPRPYTYSAPRVTYSGSAFRSSSFGRGR